MAAYTSVKSGDWNDPLTWGSASYPSVAGDTATIAAGHTVIYNVNSAIQLGTISIANTATLRCSRSMDTLIAIGGNNSLIVQNGGTLDWGTVASPIPAAYSAIMEFAPTSNGGGGLSSGSSDTNISIVGDQLYKTIKRTALVSNWTSGKTITVSGDLTTVWAIGDEILVEKYIYVSAPHLNGVFKGTIAGMALNGANTDITFNEAFSIVCYTGGFVINLNSGNVIIRKVSAQTGIGQYNLTLTPQVTLGGTTTSTRPVVKECIFIGIYLVITHNADIENCLYRNGYIGFCYSTQGTYIKNCIIAISSQAMQGAYNSIIENLIIIACGSTYYCLRTTFLNCYFLSINSISDMFRICDIRNSIFRGCAVFSSTAAGASSVFSDCYFYNNDSASSFGEKNKYERCNFGYDENGVVAKNRSGDGNMALPCDTSYFRSCNVIWGNSASVPSISGGNSPMWNRSKGPLLLYENLNQIEGSIFVYGCFGYFTKSATKKLATCSLKIEPLSNCGRVGYLSSLGLCSFMPISWTEHNVPASLQSRRVYVQGTGWTVMPTSAQLYLEAEYYNAAGAWTRTTIASTNVLSGNGVWEPLTVAFTLGRVGPVIYRVVLAKYEAGAYIYLDHALYYSATEFLEATFNWGESVLPMAPPPTFPAAADVRELIAYGTPLVPLAGTLDLPSENDVRDGVQFDNLTKEGNLELPVEDQVRLDVDYGANGTEFTGSLKAGLIDLEVGSAPLVILEILSPGTITLEVL
jgi:hypothetical protein